VPVLDEDYLILSTIHSAKGQEWKSVFVLNVVDGCIPSDRATGTSEEIEEERRLLYVAMTRAKDDLNLIVPQRFFTHGQGAQETVTFTHLGAASFQTAFSACSTRQVGRLLQPALPRAVQLEACASTSAPACEGCGDEGKCMN
jgi:superfamily I DNA/RNA helicase